MESPARNRALRLLVGLFVGVSLVFLIAADAAQAISCSGSIAKGEKSDPRRGTRPTVTLQFTCDQTVTGFEVRFGGAEVEEFDVTAAGTPSTCDSVDTSGFDCSVYVPAGTLVSGSPTAGEGYEPVCSAPVTITFRGPAVTEPFVFQPTNLCPTTPPPTLRVSFGGTGSGTLEINDTSCTSNCWKNFPAGTRVQLRAVPASGSTFAGWSGACTGTSTDCTVTLDSDKTVTATFNLKGVIQPTGKVHASVDSAVKVTGTSLSFTLGCHAPSGKTCTVLAVLTTTQHMRSGKVIAVSSRTRSTTTKKVVTLAKKSLTIAAGAKKTVTLSLNRTGKALLARFHKLPARLTVSLTNATKPTVVVSKTVTFKQQKKATKRGR